MPYIKIDVDNNKKNGRHWLTGSQQFQLMQDISESLAGRAGIINLIGLSSWEISKQPQIETPFLPDRASLTKRAPHIQSLSLQKLYQIIWQGSFPRFISEKQKDKNLFYSSYVQTYIQRDVRQITNVGDESAFLRFLKVAAARTGQLVNLAEIAKDSDISPNTAKHWLSILQTSGIIYLLEPYNNNLTKRLIKTPKLYFTDTGLCSYLTQWTDAITLEAGAMSGSILETYVVTEILKSYWHNGLQAPLYFYRAKDKKEIDLLIIQNQQIYPIEIKKTAKPSKEAIKHFSVLDKLGTKITSGALICLTPIIIPITEKINAVPISAV